MTHRRIQAIALLLAGCGGLTTEGAPPWIEIEAIGPSPRWGHTMVLDAARDRVLLFGGTGERGKLADLWAFDLELERWSEIEDGGDVPSPRITAAAIVDPARDRMILVGGESGVGYGDDGAFALDLETHVWTRLPDLPRGRYDVIAAVEGSRAYFFAGYAGISILLDDLWELDLETDSWRPLPDDGTRPSPRSNGAIAYASGFLYTTGGHDDVGATDDTWRYDLAAGRWERLDRIGDPLVGAHYAFARDPRCEVLYLFGGDDNDYFDVASLERMTLEERARFDRVPVSELPDPRRHSAMIADPVRERLVVFGGASGFETSFEDTWTIDLPACP
jgi:hypothetical protein